MKEFTKERKYLLRAVNKNELIIHVPTGAAEPGTSYTFRAETGGRLVFDPTGAVTHSPLF